MHPIGPTSSFKNASGEGVDNGHLAVSNDVLLASILPLVYTIGI